MDHRVTNGDGAVELLAEIVGRVFFSIKLKRCRNVVDRGDRRNNRLKIFDGVIECRGINEGLEDRPGLAMRESMVQLAFAVVASTDKGANLACSRIERDKRHLRSRHGLAGFFPGCIPPGQELINLLHPVINRSCSRALKTGIESRVDAVTLAL